MGLPYHTAMQLEMIWNLHGREFGKIAQKLLALSFVDMGFRLAEERAVQGVDIDVVNDEGGEKLSIEVKTSMGSKVSIGKKDLEGLESRRRNDGYRPYFAFLFKPHCLGDGWMLVPAANIGEGDSHAMRLAGKVDAELTARVNAAFPGVVERILDDLLDCPEGQALGMLREKHGI